MSCQTENSGNAEVTQFPIISHKKNYNCGVFSLLWPGFQVELWWWCCVWMVGCFGFFSLWLSSTVSKLTEKLAGVGQT